MNSNKLGQKRADRRKVARDKVLRRRTKLRAEARVQRELDKIRDANTPRASPIRNNYDR